MKSGCLVVRFVAGDAVIRLVDDGFVGVERFLAILAAGEHPVAGILMLLWPKTGLHVAGFSIEHLIAAARDVVCSNLASLQIVACAAEIVLVGPVTRLDATVFASICCCSV